MKLNKYIIGLFIGSTSLLTACSDFLDQAPDNRTEIETPGQVSRLLTTAYFTGNYSTLCELSGDNIVDNNAPYYDESSQKTVYYNLPSLERMDDEIFAWEPAESSVAQDSPSAVWEGCYGAIATANHVLQAIDKLEKEGKGSEVQASKGEALLIRAYNHFLLVNMFCQAYRNDELSKDPVNAMGIPYVTEPEQTVHVRYNRGTVTEVYNKIEKDLLEGLPLLPTSSDLQGKYHFNKQAANAFAARYYLYKRNYDKVIEHATAVFDGNPLSYMRDYMKYEGMSTSKAMSYEYINAENASNLMLVSTYSVFTRLFGGYRYACNHAAAKGTIYGTGPSWSLMPIPSIATSGAFVNGSQEYGLFGSKALEIFEYTDKVAGIGYPHIVRAEFTAEEAVLCRAEAYIFKKDFVNAFADLKIWDDSRKNVPASYQTYFSDFTPEAIAQFYSDDNRDAKYYVFEYNTDKMSPDFIITPEMKPYVDCLMHYRRIETLFDGLRWFDIKRYGLEIEHAIGGGRNGVVKKLSWDDSRRALQIPQEVIAAGMEATYRLLPPTTGEAKKLPTSYYRTK